MEWIYQVPSYVPGLQKHSCETLAPEKECGMQDKLHGLLSSLASKLFQAITKIIRIYCPFPIEYTI